MVVGAEVERKYSVRSLVARQAWREVLECRRDALGQDAVEAEGYGCCCSTPSSDCVDEGKKGKDEEIQRRRTLVELREKE